MESETVLKKGTLERVSKKSSMIVKGMQDGTGEMTPMSASDDKERVCICILSNILRFSEDYLYIFSY